MIHLCTRVLHLSQVKRIVSIGLILLMSLQCFYKLGIVTYFELNRNYIAEVLCINKAKPVTMCQGQCFLNRNLELADDPQPDDGTSPPATQKIDFPAFVISDNQYPAHEMTEPQLHNARYLPSVSGEHSPAPFHPPALYC